MATARLITPLSIIPSFSATQRYPSSPMTCLPIPTPLSTSLRQRSGLSLQLSIAPPVGPPKGDIQPQSNKLPRRRRTKTMSTPEAEETPELIQIPVVESPKEETAEIEPLVPAALNAPKVEEEVSKPDSSLQELIPGLYIAFSNDGPEGEQPGDSSEKPYTHIVNITHPTHDVDQNFKGSAHESYDHSLRRLHLVLAQSSSRMNKAQRTGLALSELQLRSVRDFLALALPPSLASSTDQSTVKVLITTPHGRPTDAMSAAACYLAFTSGQNVDTILRFVDEEEDFLSVWKGEVSEDEVEKIEKVVRSPSS